MIKPHLCKIFLFVEIAVLAFFLTGCKSAYYKTMETFGKHKRDILVSRVGNARDAQEDAKEQFQSALEKFTSVVKVPSSKLQSKYDQLNAEFERSEAKATAVTERIAEVESVAEDLFDEWDTELDKYTNKELRRSSAQKHKQTRGRYEQLIGAMKQAERKIEPVLSAFRDQVLFLKHNLNAQAVASLQDELVSIESDVAGLIKEMDESIAEANKFISTMGTE